MSGHKQHYNPKATFWMRRAEKAMRRLEEGEALLQRILTDFTPQPGTNKTVFKWTATLAEIREYLEGTEDRREPMDEDPHIASIEMLEDTVRRMKHGDDY